MQPILDHVARANHVAQQFLEYVGLQDERQTVGKVIYHFNILDPAHRRYRSTVTFVETATSERSILWAQKTPISEMQKLWKELKKE